MTFINRARVLIGFVIFKARWRNNKNNFLHNNETFIVSSQPLTPKNISILDA